MVEKREEIEERLREEKEESAKVRLIFFNTIANHGLNFESTCGM